MSSCKIVNLKDDIFAMRECSGQIIIKDNQISLINVDYNDENFDELFENKNLNKILDKYSSSFVIKNFQGVFPWGIYEGDSPSVRGENILISLDDFNYILIESGYPEGYTSTFEVDEKITNGFYVVCSGGDPGSFFAMSANYIYSLNEYPGTFRIRRDFNFESKYNCYECFDIIDLYLSIRGTASRGFGYQQRNFDENYDKLYEKSINLIPNKKKVIDIKLIKKLKSIINKYQVYNLLKEYNRLNNDIIRIISQKV